MIAAAQRIIANAITSALRHPWRIDGFDYRGNHTGPTSPFRLTANPPAKPPHVFVERFVWGITDPDEDLSVPPMAWHLIQADYELTIRAHPTHALDWRELLNDSTALPFRPATNRHGNRSYRRSEYATNAAAMIALALAASAHVSSIPAWEYRDAFPIGEPDTQNAVA